MIARKHPVCNWLRLAPADTAGHWIKVLQFRDSSDNPMASGMPEAAVTWFGSRSYPGC
jgi:hypothetical protein